jgi:branched-subunit amino acid aminotransferase/4-amino-4-deoxychorismate lyase
VFTTAGCDRGRPLLWERHDRRLRRSAEALDPSLEVRLPSEDALRSLLASDGHSGPARLRVVVRRVAPGCGWTVEASAASARRVGPSQPPVALRTVPWQAAPPWTGHKTLARLAWDHARESVRGAGADDALLVDAESRLLETSVANVLVRSGDVVATPPAPQRCLPGILRGWLLEALPRIGVTVRERDVGLHELAAADEVWISNAVAGVRRVGAVDELRWSRHDAFERVVALGVPAPGWPHFP